MAMFSYNLSVWCDISEKNMVIVVIGGTVIRYHMLLMLITYHLALCQIWVIMATFSYSLCLCCYISENNGVILFVFGTVIRYQVLLTHVKYNLALYHIWVGGSHFLWRESPKRVWMHSWFYDTPPMCFAILRHPHLNLVTPLDIMVSHCFYDLPPPLPH